MKQAELRIGNWCRQIATGTNTQVSPFMFHEIYDDDCYTDYLLPIKLTDEWLANFGFDNRHESHWKSVYSDGVGAWDFILEKPTEKEKRYCFGLARVEFVHQLQNLYFAMVGEELLTS